MCIRDSDIVNTTSTFAINKTATTTSTLPIDLVQTFTFDIDCGAAGTAQVTVTTAADGSGSVSNADGIPLVAPGTSCVVTETNLPPDWTVTSTNPASVSTVAGSIAEVEFTNEPDLVELSVVKVIDGLPAALDPDDFSFLIDITCVGGFSTIDGTYQELGAPLSTVQPTLLSGLPAMTECTVVEAATNEFTPQL